ncbi:MAG: hypothetical protein ACETVP_06245 [Candidatus Bathyarchaeia archaeon]
MKGQVCLVTKREYQGCQRKLAWFKKYQNGIYFDIFGFFMGSHTSYHRDGRIFRTSHASDYQTRKEYLGKYLPLDDFKEWYQLGTSMILKSELLKNPCLMKRDRKKALILQEVDLEAYPSDFINIVVEFLEPGKTELLTSKDVAPPPDATILVISSVQPWIVLTILGHEHNLVIKPKEDGFIVHHFNSRYSTNLPGVKYRFEAYG